jgi:hypothetical protein
MTTNAKPGIGAKLNRWNTVPSTAVWEEIVEVTALSDGGPSRNVIETFKLNNADDYVNKLQGVLNAGSITATINFTQAQYITLKTDMETRGDQEYQIVFPDGEGLEWAGFISELPLDLGSDDVMQGDVVFEVNGKPDFVSSASAAPA